MSYTIKTRSIVIGAIISLFLTFFGGWYYGHVREKKASQIASNALIGVIQNLTVQINDTEYALTKTEQELMTERELRKQDITDKATLKALNIKQLKELTRLKLRIDTLLEDVANNGEVIVIDSPATINKDSVGNLTNAIRLPFTFDKSDKWLSLRGDFDRDGKLDISLKMEVPVDVYSAIDKTTKKNTLYLTTPNTYIQTLSVRSYKTDVQKPKRYGIGAMVGYGVCRNGLSPFVGVGLSFSPIQF